MGNAERGAVDFSLTAEQKELYQQQAELGRKLSQGAADRDRDGTFSSEAWLSLASSGLLGCLIPKEYGGQGHDLVTSIAMLEGFGYGCTDNGLNLAVNGQLWSVQEPLLSIGTEDQKRRYLPGLCRGEMVAAHGMTEPDSGSNAFALETRAEKVEGGYKLSGRKWLIGLGPVCQLALVFASTAPARGSWGLSAFLVESDSEGFVRHPVRDKMGLRSSPLGDLEFKDVLVPESNRLGQEGAGMAIFNATMEWERAFIFTSHLGRMRRQLEECVDYANRRVLGGQPIGRHQSVSHRLAEMKVRYETSRLLLYRTAWLKSQGRPATMEATMTKLHLGEALVASSLDAIRIHGGRGYLTEFEVERDLRDTVGGVIYSGTSDIQKNLIARLLGVK